MAKAFEIEIKLKNGNTLNICELQKVPHTSPFITMGTKSVSFTISEKLTVTVDELISHTNLYGLSYKAHFYAGVNFDKNKL